MTATYRPAQSRLNRTVIADEAARRWDRLHGLESAIDDACELAVRQSWRRDDPHAHPDDQLDDRTRWDRHAWSIYVREALTQAYRHGSELASLRRDAERLNHLVECLS